MNDVDSGTVKLTELLRNPDDLDKIAALKSEFTRKKAGVDSQLRIGLQEQLAVTQSGMSSITDGQHTVDLIKAEMQKIDKLCAEAQNMIKDFPHINTVAQTHRNFSQVEEMRQNIEMFDQQLTEVERMLQEDEVEMINQPEHPNQTNLLPIHYKLNKLRDIREDILDQVKSSGEMGEELVNNLQLSSGATLSAYFERLNGTVEWFDDHIGVACMQMIELVQMDNPGLVTRLAVVIHDEEKNDKKARALQDAQQEYKELASRFKSITAGKKEIRGYKEKFLLAIETRAMTRFDESNKIFEEDSEKLEKSVRWYFEDLNAVKLGMTNLMPPKWKIFQTYTKIYHRLMHDWLISLIDDPNSNPQQLLAVVNWSDKYYSKMAKLQIPQEWMKPHVIDDRASEVIREYRQLIIKTVDEWMERMAKTDSLAVLNSDESTLEQDENKHLKTKTLADMWRMLREQIEVAKSSNRTDIVEGVFEAMFRALESRQRMWTQLVDSEVEKYTDPNYPIENISVLQDFLIAIANDQMNCIDDVYEDQGIVSYLTRFSNEVQPLVSADFVATVLARIDTLRDGYVDLSTHCLTAFARLISIVDFRPLLPEFFTKDWYLRKGMERAITTYEDYLVDFQDRIADLLRDILAEEMAVDLLVRYLGCVRNKGVKFRRQDAYLNKIRDDVLLVFGYFEKYDSFESIKDKWRAVESFTNLLDASKADIPEVYERLKMDYWDVGMGWVEACLRARDDFDRALLNAVKAKAASMEVVRGTETVMAKVK